MAGDGARALQAAKQGQIATLVLPADCAWNQAVAPALPLPAILPAKAEAAAIDRAAAALKNGKKTALLMRGDCLQRRGLEAAGRIAQHSGARLLHDYFMPRMTRGEGLVEVERIPYFSEQIVECLEGLEQIILVGAPPPVTFFAYPDKPSWVTPQGCDLITLAGEREDATGALESLADALCAKQAGRIVKRVIPDMPVHAALAERGRRADRYGTTVAFRSDLASFAALERALSRAACPWFGVDLDPVAVLRDEWPLDEIFSRLGPLIRHVRGRDATRGGGGRTMPAVIGQGTTNWGELRAALDGAGYSGWITIDSLEHPDRRAAAVACGKIW